MGGRWIQDRRDNIVTGLSGVWGELQRAGINLRRVGGNKRASLKQEDKKERDITSLASSMKRVMSRTLVQHGRLKH